jgi:hypothetical protein
MSYAPNALVFGGVGPGTGLVWASNPARIPGTFRDGTSNTVLYVEKYGNCPADGLDPDTTGRQGMLTSTNWAWPGQAPNVGGGQYECNMVHWNFPYVKQSDGTWLAVGPLFQVNPTPDVSNFPCTQKGGQGQGAHDGAIQVAMGDGSVRGVTQAMSIQTWSAVLTPAFNDVPGPDWAE